MNTQNKIRHICPKFAFEGIAVSRELEKEANAEFEKILDLAPPGACGAGILFRSVHRYCATVVVESPCRNFTERVAGTNPSAVVDKVLAKLENDLLLWRQGTGAPQNLAVAHEDKRFGRRAA
jgi:hypothetical protein